MLLQSLDCFSTFETSWLTRISSLKHPMSWSRSPSGKNRPKKEITLSFEDHCDSNVNQLLFRIITPSVGNTSSFFSTPVNKCHLNRRFPGKVPYFSTVKILFLLRNFTRIYGVFVLLKFQQNPYWHCISLIFRATGWINLYWKPPSFGQFLPHN